MYCYDTKEPEVLGSMRNPDTCPHNVTNVEPDTGEIWCKDCGDVLDSSTPEGREALRFHLSDEAAERYLDE